MAGQRNVVLIEDCLKAIFSVGEWDPRARTNGDVAARLGVSASTTSELVRQLVADGLVDHEPYGPVQLTDAGLAQALQMVRRHRLLETYLVTGLGYSWDEVHDEAEVLEHAVSDLMLRRIDSTLGHPWRDPHGDAIPTPDGVLHLPAARPLAGMEPGEGGFVARILDEDPALLRWFDDMGVALDVRLVVEGHRPFGGALAVRLGEGDQAVDLGIQAASSLWIADDAPLPGVDDPFVCRYATCQHLGPGSTA
ncbi:metal-dependent transcriptional regulator [Aeromicrobium sp. CF3.5]|uniref:metal-dependent transcriptional regulator n=1 Tax=Aeromicrobium sp. CF3.5 TaxID=3373078 RepID=UPI003EE57854